MFSRFFIDRPILASVPSILDHASGPGGRLHAAGCAISRDHAAHGAGRLQLSRGQRPSGGRHRGRADRAAGQRRGGHALHVVAMRQRRQLHPDRDLQSRHEPEHGPGVGAESRGLGVARAARRGQTSRRDGQEAIARPDVHHQPGFARRALRPALSEQLRGDPTSGRPDAHRGRGRRDRLRPTRLQHARLARSRPFDRHGHHGRRRGRVRCASRTCRWRPARSGSSRPPRA